MGGKIEGPGAWFGFGSNKKQVKDKNLPPIHHPNNYPFSFNFVIKL